METAPTQENLWGSLEGQSSAVSTFTSEVENSKEENKWRDRGEEEGLPGFRAHWARRCGNKSGQVEELRAGLRPPFQASSDSHHHPGHQWRFPGKR